MELFSGGIDTGVKFKDDSSAVLRLDFKAKAEVGKPVSSQSIITI